MSADRPMLGRRTCLDANLYIYAFEDIETYRMKMAKLLAAINRQGVRVIASELLFTELLPRPMKDGRQDMSSVIWSCSGAPDASIWRRSTAE